MNTRYIDEQHNYTFNLTKTIRGEKMKYFHIATNEWIDSKELQRRLDKKYNFQCNECHKRIGEHIGVIAEGIFCPNCKESIMNKLISQGGIPVNLDDSGFCK